MSRLQEARNIADLRALARRRLPRGVFEYVDRGSEDEVALRNNRAAFERIRLRPHVLVDVSRRSTAAPLLGRVHAMPLVVAPTGAAGLVWHEGELAIAAAAAAADVPFTLATGSMTGMEKIARVGGRLWFQLYMWADRGLSHALVARARAAGFEGLVVTVDTPVMANREYNPRNGFALPFHPTGRAIVDMLAHPAWLTQVLFRYVATTGMPRYENMPPGHQRRITRGGAPNPLMRSDSLTWEDVKKLRELWPGRLMIKGILRPDDARQAVAIGADAVIVSNHGGRNLDCAVAPIEALPSVVTAVGGRAAVLVDSGVRRGTDIIKALALGAQGVLAGRAPLYGAAVAGQAGAAHALALLQREMDIAMAMTGCPTVAAIGPDLVDAADQGMPAKRAAE
jgi:isopentenyl diphosphate isomerase/L-lactate dehydrogenase-like FMN-dependent dehydrogenase